MNLKDYARQSVLDVLRAKQKCEFLEEVLADRTDFRRLDYRCHAVAVALAKIAEDIVAIQSALPDTDFPIEDSIQSEP